MTPTPMNGREKRPRKTAMHPIPTRLHVIRRVLHPARSWLLRASGPRRLVRTQEHAEPPLATGSGSHDLEHGGASRLEQIAPHLERHRAGRVLRVAGVDDVAGAHAPLRVGPRRVV